MLNQYLEKLKIKGEVYLRIKARPNAGQTEITDKLETEEGDTLKIDVAAPPEKNKANKEIIKFLAKEFSTTKDNVKIISGMTEKIKLVKIIK
jgi:hypothetical protein